MTDLSPDKAQEYYSRGMDLKSRGQNEAALTEFRRAALANPDHFEAQLEIGLLCKLKSNSDSIFLRHAYEALKKAARLNLLHQQTHEQYIMVGQKLGYMEDLHREYDALAKKYPDNALLQQCAKNIVTLSMAMMPDPVNLSNSNAGTFRKLALFLSLGLLLIAAALLVGPTMLKKTKKPDLAPERIASLAKLGILCGMAGIGGFVVRARIKD